MQLRLRELRKAKGYTIDQVADLSGLSRGFISQLENGRREPSVESLRVLSDALKVSTQQLFAGPEDNGLNIDAAFADIARLNSVGQELLRRQLRMFLETPDLLQHPEKSDEE